MTARNLRGAAIAARGLRDAIARRVCGLACVLGLLWAAPAALAQAKKVYLNPSSQTGNPVAGGGNEATYALINANLTKTILVAAGYNVTVDQDFYNAPSNANSWGADIFVSIHSNAGGGHGTETLYKTTGGQALASKVQNGLLAELPYSDRGLKVRTDLHVLNSTNMYACLPEVVFHDCASTSTSYKGHPPSESSYLKSSSGQASISKGLANGICLYYGSTCGTAPQKGTITGVVYKAPNLTDVLDGATVKLSSGPSTTTTSSGSFSFEVTAGTYTVTASKAGYQPASRTVSVAAGQQASASIGLTAGGTDGGAGDGARDTGPRPPREAGAGDGGWTDGGEDGGGEGCECRAGGGARAPLAPLLLLGALLFLGGACRRRRA